MKNSIPTNKHSTNFNATVMTVIDKSSPRVTVKDNESGKYCCRNSGHLKKINCPSQTNVQAPLVQETPIEKSKPHRALKRPSGYL